MPDDEEERQEEAIKSYYDILAQKISQGLAEIERSSSGLFLSGLSAGLDIGFSVLLMAVTLTLTAGVFPYPVIVFLLANMYSVGFILVIFGRSELFTEHTSLAIFPVLSKRASIRSLLRLWVLIWVSNLLGAAVFAFLLVVIGLQLNIIEKDAFERIAATLVFHPWRVILLSAILAGWLMGLVSWLVTAGRETISQIFFVWLITSSIGLGRLHHCIVGTVEMLPAVYLGMNVSFLDFLWTLLWSTVGNAIGGVVFVALIKFAHIARGEKTQ